jgi:hypothetical protein
VDSLKTLDPARPTREADVIAVLDNGVIGHANPRARPSRIGTSKDGQVIVDAILGIAKEFGLTTTAEGVESAAKLAYLKVKGCSVGQGYLFSKPSRLPTSRSCSTSISSRLP